MIALTDAALAPSGHRRDCHCARRTRALVATYAAQIDPTPQAAYNHRRKSGKRVLRIEVEMGPLSDLLIDHGFLQEWDSEDVEAVRRALEEALRVWSLYA